MKKITDSKRYSIITDDLEHCYVCGGKKECLHEVFFGKNRQASKNYGMVIPLCNYHHNASNEGVHFNKKLDIELKEKAEKCFLEIEGNTIKKFIEIFRQELFIRRLYEKDNIDTIGKI